MFYTDSLAAKMQRGYFKSKVLNQEATGLIPSKTPVMHRKVHKSKRLSVHEKIMAIHAVLVDHEFQSVVAK